MMPREGRGGVEATRRTVQNPHRPLRPEFAPIASVGACRPTPQDLDPADIGTT